LRLRRELAVLLKQVEQQRLILGSLTVAPHTRPLMVLLLTPSRRPISAYDKPSFNNRSNSARRSGSRQNALNSTTRNLIRRLLLPARRDSILLFYATRAKAAMRSLATLL
jgi:hypothetical protein